MSAVRAPRASYDENVRLAPYSYEGAAGSATNVTMTSSDGSGGHGAYAYDPRGYQQGAGHQQGAGYQQGAAGMAGVGTRSTWSGGECRVVLVCAGMFAWGASAARLSAECERGHQMQPLP